MYSHIPHKKPTKLCAFPVCPAEYRGPMRVSGAGAPMGLPGSWAAGVCAITLPGARCQAPGWHQAPPWGWGWAKGRPGCGSALRNGWAAQLWCCWGRGWWAGGTDMGPWATSKWQKPRGSRDSQTCRWPWDPGAGWSVFLSRMFWKNIYFCQVPCYSGDMKWCRIQFLLHYWIFKKLKEQTNTSL